MNAITIYKSDIELRREIKPEALVSLTTVERAVFTASTSKTIAEYTDGELTKDLIDCLKWIAKDIGYKSASQEEAAYLLVRAVQILKGYYSQLTLDEFRMAFEMLCAGELDEFLPKDKYGQPDRSHYQSFNAEYIGKVLKAYVNRRTIILRKVKLPMQKEERNMEEEKMIEGKIKEELKNNFLEYKYRGRMPYLTNIQQVVYLQMLGRVGLCDEYKVSEGEQATIFSGLFAKLSGKRMDGYERTDALRRMALKRVFDTIIAEEMQISDYLN